MNIDDQFDAIFKINGGRFPADQRTQQLEYCLNYMRSSLDEFQKQAKVKFNVHIDYVVNDMLQAGVVKYGDTYFIGINYGGVFILCDLFMRMMSSPDLLKEYGDSSKENSSKLFNVQTKYWKHIYLSKANETIIEPQDETRILIGELLTVFCLSYLAFHELGHVFLGHKEFKEHIFQKGDTISSSFQQAMEIEADNFSLNMTVRNLLTKDITFGSDRMILIKREQIKEKLFLWHFALYSFWRLYGNENINLLEARQDTHPPIRVRQYNIMAMAATICVEEMEAKINLEDMKEIVAKSALHVEYAFANISEQPLNSSVLPTIYSAEHKEYASQLNTVLLDEVINCLRDFRHFDPEEGDFKSGLKQ